MTISINAGALDAQTDQISRLIEAVEKADSSPALFAAVRQLADVADEEAIPTLVAALSYNNPGAAIAAVSGLVRLGRLAVPAIVEQLDLHNYSARAWAVRALAEIGDPRGLVTLLDAATSDFAVSVRRAATKGLGEINWQEFPTQKLLEQSQEIALSALLQIAQQDHEWVVRYAAITGLERFAFGTKGVGEGEMRSHIQLQLQQMIDHEQSVAVHARIRMAQHRLNIEKTQDSMDNPPDLLALTDLDWSKISQKLDEFSNSEVGLTLVEPH
ncbi:MAG: HEAT repeat domain-containing protein [Thermosynechococcaceae cyanobacterium]